MRIRSVEALNKALETPYNIEWDYKNITDTEYLLTKIPKSLLELINYLSVDSLEHIDLLNDIIKDFEGLKVPSNQKYVIKLDLKTMTIEEIFQNLLADEKTLENAYLDIYDNTDEELVRNNYKGSLVIFYWLFKSLAQLERKHYDMIIYYQGKIQNLENADNKLGTVGNIEYRRS
ncbi:MAG: hypothetical protein ACP5RY_06160 [Thermoplasmata archaeon]